MVALRIFHTRKRRTTKPQVYPDKGPHQRAEAMLRDPAQARFVSIHWARDVPTHRDFSTSPASPSSWPTPHLTPTLTLIPMHSHSLTHSLTHSCQETSSFTIVHLLHRTVHVQLHGAIQCTLDRGLEPKDSCQRKTIQRRAQTNDKQTAAEFYMVAEQGSW